VDGQKFDNAYYLLTIITGLLEHWDRGFESHMRYGYVSASLCVVLPLQALRWFDPTYKEFCHIV
jgi:hypothetical protein